jgi:hypothetical protein
MKKVSDSRCGGSQCGSIREIYPGDNLLFNSRGEMPRANFIPMNYPTTILILGAHDLVDIVLAVLLSEELARLVQISSLPQYLMY